MWIVLALACTVEEGEAEQAPVTCDEGAALLRDVCDVEGVVIDLDTETADCQSRPEEWQECWLQCVFDERDAGCDPAMLDCADACVTE